MANLENIQAALRNVGSDACWTVPGDVEWDQSGVVTSMAPAPSTDLSKRARNAAVSDTAREILEAMKTSEQNGDVRDITSARSYSAAPHSLVNFGHTAVGPNIIDTAAL